MKRNNRLFRGAVLIILIVGRWLAPPPVHAEAFTEVILPNNHSIVKGIPGSSNGPLIWTEPAFPSQFDDVTVFYDAREGNGELAGFEGPVYAHTGVITNFSENDNDWQHVIGNWGTADDRVLMKKEGDIYSISYNISSFYGLAPGEMVRQMAFVFRNTGGTRGGRAADGGDIFTEVFSSNDGFIAQLLSPQPKAIVSPEAGTFVQAQTNVEADFVVRLNGNTVFTGSGTEIEYRSPGGEPGFQDWEVLAVRGEDTIALEQRTLVLETNRPAVDPEAETRDGLNYRPESYLFQLDVGKPGGKSHVFLLCPANDFCPHPDYLMSQSTDGRHFWIELSRTTFANGQNTYQYLVDGEITIADPYSEIVLDPIHDPFIQGAVMDELPAYPDGAAGIVTAFDPEPASYPWENDNFDRPANTNLVIYELLLRDFLEDRSYASLVDTLDYLQNLGINAIELMPIQEFEGNISWGYNPSFHLAVDKFYGSRTELKRFIDEAHARGIAVILDVVFNHTFSQGPLAQLYWDGANFRPSSENPWLNVTPRHPFNVGYDFNHESDATRQWVKRNLEHWIRDFHFDGFRFDLSKGLTQTNSGNDAGRMSQYDASRVAILKDYADFIWSLDAASYVIMEHFADNREETELANYGMMLWGNNNHQFNEAAMGYRSDLDGADYTLRGWNEPHLISYMESHDEERLMYKVLRYGADESGYNTKDLPTALERIAAASTIFFTIPGPKMMWQFGELGYEFSINRCKDGRVTNECRLDEKPVRWDYLDQPNRENLREIISSIIRLRTTYPTFSTTDFTLDDNDSFLKTVHLNHNDMDAVALANFQVINSNLDPKFQYPGTWYEFFTGDSLVVEDINEQLTFSPGEYRIYTSERITPPREGTTSVTREQIPITNLEVFPNPVQAGSSFQVDFTGRSLPEVVRLFAPGGRKQLLAFEKMGNNLRVRLPDEQPAGLYFVEMFNGQAKYTAKLVLLN